MSNKNFIGGGFPGIRECTNEPNNITQESVEKREFSIKKIISINNILKKTLNTNQTNNTEYLNIKDAVQYDSIENIIHNPYIEETNIDINMINRPIKKKSRKKSKKKY
jgi:hypothetical protein